MDRPGIIVLVGPMGAGKTTIGRALADVLGLDHLDSDVDLRTATGTTGRAIAEADGVVALHRLEAEVLLDRLTAAMPVVVSAAASVVDRADVRAALRDVLVVWLDASVELVAERLDGGEHRRRVDLEEIRRLDLVRRPRYEQIADLRLDATIPVGDAVAAIRGAAGA